MLSVGDKVERYVIASVLGQGAFGVVYRLRHTTLSTDDDLHSARELLTEAACRLEGKNPLEYAKHRRKRARVEAMAEDCDAAKQTLDKAEALAEFLGVLPHSDLGRAISQARESMTPSTRHSHRAGPNRQSFLRNPSAMLRQGGTGCFGSATKSSALLWCLSLDAAPTASFTM